MKKLFPLGASALIVIFIFSLQFNISSCTKDKTTIVHDTTVTTIHDTTTIIDSPVVCNVQGTYVGLTTASPSASTAGSSGTNTYILGPDNLALGSLNPSPTIVTFGGYTNTCDSIIISAYYTANQNYYVLKGALSNNRTVLSGTYQNLTFTSDYGTFSFVKQ